MRVSASFVLERDRAARPANACPNGAFAAWGSKVSYSTLPGVASLTPAIPGAIGGGRCQAWLPQPAGLAFHARKLSINADNPGFGTTTR